MSAIVLEKDNVENKPSSTRKNNLDVLDLLRGFAAVSVLLLHYTSNNGLAKFHSPFLMDAFGWGNMGVEVFFVISGFIIPYSLWGSGYRVREFVRFMIKRMARILPPAYICIALILVQWAVVDYAIKGLSIGRLDQLTASQLVKNLLFLYPFFDKGWINPVFWTLSVEFQFYILIGLFYEVLFDRNTVLNLVLAFLGFSLVYYFFATYKHGFLAYSPLFALGGITLYFKKQRLNLWVYATAMTLFFVLAYLSLGTMSAMFGLAAALVIAFVKVQPSFLSVFGKISYSLYLTHLLVGGTTEFVLSKVFHPTTELGNIAAIVICLITACLFAYAYFKLVEQPVMRFARHLKL